MIADLQRGRTYNSKLIRSFMSFLSGVQLSTDKVILQFMHFFIVPTKRTFLRLQIKMETRNMSSTYEGSLQTDKDNRRWRCRFSYNMLTNQFRVVHIYAALHYKNKNNYFREDFQ